MNFKKDREFVGITVLVLDEKVNSLIHGFIPVGRANHDKPSLKAYSIVKVDRFEVARLFDNLQVIGNTNLELPDVVGQIRSVQGSDLTKKTTRVVIRFLIDPLGTVRLECSPQNAPKGQLLFKHPLFIPLPTPDL
ncbi:hypothetical protein DY000_02062046 [Brassica cretica]|uniref:DUF223 domain-containing protein n=1 Tax=Brassica cretica TaxID=69181 RepID=A0ABQ7AUI5_BRACR|nr:hypothetical protein DY000_02062046 [Brassica cretica]